MLPSNAMTIGQLSRRTGVPIKVLRRYEDLGFLYTTYNQAYYYADLKRLPRLSEEQRRSLITSSASADNPHLMTHIKQHLIESYLHFAKHYAIDLCPRSRYHRDLPDLIGIANLTVVEVITRADLTSYLAAYLRGRLKEATINDGLIHITTSVRARSEA